MSQWTVPPRPPLPGGGREPIRPSMVFLGIGTAILGHLVIIGGSVLAAYVSKGLNAPLTIVIIGEFALFVACLSIGIVWITRPRRDRGIGVGLLIGWAVGALVLPVVGFGVCVALVSGTNGGNL